MTQEDKNKKLLLLKDLSARLPYEVICKIAANDKPCLGDHKLSTFWLDKVTDICYEIKPYLRPMSSMTEEERLESLEFAWEDDYGRLASYDENIPKYIDWLNSHHFDYRGLIEKGLAIEAPEGMYKNKN